MPRKKRNKRQERVKLQPKSQRVPLGQCVLSEEITSKVEELLLLGVPETAAHEYLTIARRTYYNWKRWGQDYLDADPENRNPLHRRYAGFVLRVKRAKAEWHIRVMRRSFQTSFKPTWIRDMALLERRCRDEWGKSSTLPDAGNQRELLDPDESFI